ncbi:Uncharacterised protein [Streptococcus pneumoniae]|nr:Uncharacterised protein [Streptococcus pneumoniae]VJV85941.1 Uncharacterised protein [Streptococcus pneumoniae]VNM96962.1 Uncharacterised protein [Streptococcus pneumoniae]
MAIFTWSYSYFWSLTIFSAFTFVTLRAFDVALFIPVAVILNEDVACFCINVFIAVFTLICFWVNFAVQHVFTVTSITSVTTCCSIRTFSSLRSSQAAFASVSFFAFSTICTFVTFRAFDVALFIPVAVILNEDVACFCINVFIAVFTLMCFWVSFAVQHVFTVTSITTYCAIRTFSSLRSS